MIIQRMDTTAALDGVAEVPDLGVIEARGEEARKFLHAQLTQDFLLLPEGQARLAAFCSAKGRVLASFVAVPLAADAIALVCSRDLLATTLKRLSMFVLRSKLKLRDATEEFVLRGVAGPTLLQLAGSAAVPWHSRPAAGGQLVSLYPADGVPRALWIAPATQAAALEGHVRMHADAWRLSEVRSGVASVGATVADAFVPQMLNYESVGGVNFKKGCYPGQEVVARSQFRGTLKRRARLARCEQAGMQPGQEIFRADEPEQPCATVVQSAPGLSGGSEAIVSGQLAAFDSGVALHLGSAQGPLVRVSAELPYALLDDI